MQYLFNYFFKVDICILGVPKISKHQKIVHYTPLAADEPKHLSLKSGSLQLETLKPETVGFEYC